MLAIQHVLVSINCPVERKDLVKDRPQFHKVRSPQRIEEMAAASNCYAFERDRIAQHGDWIERTRCASGESNNCYMAADCDSGERLLYGARTSGFDYAVDPLSTGQFA